MRSHLRPKVLPALVAVALIALAVSQGIVSRAQRTGAGREANENSASSTKSKRVVVVRSSDTGSGSRVTITADDTLKDYSAYRSGDRFYVVLPKAAAGARGGGSGRGYTDMQVQQRGDSVVLSYRVQPGAKPRVEQKHNRLDVVFDVPEGGAGGASQDAGATPQPTPVASVSGNQNASVPPANQAAVRATPQASPASIGANEDLIAKYRAEHGAPNGNAAPANTGERDPADATGRQSDPVRTVDTGAEASQTAQAQPPIARDADALSSAAPAPSLGAALLRNWVAGLLTATLLVSLGLFLVQRRRTAGEGAKRPAVIAAKMNVQEESEAEERLPASTFDAGAQTLADGAVLQNRYRVVRHLGRGGMGSVYEAIDQRLGRTVALKMTLARSAHLRRAFEREARILANLSHPALPRVIDHFGEDDEQFLVMDYVPGADLKVLLEQQGHPFAEGEVLRWADELLDALEYLHSHKSAVIHRDIKPSNLKLTAKRGIALLDFGLAKGAVGETTSATISRSVMGYSPHFAPPEQMQGERTDPRSDLYSLAAALYHLLAGQKPTDALRRVAAQLNDEPDPLRPLNEVNLAISANTSSVIMQALALKPSQRWPSAVAMRAAFKEDASSANSLETDISQTPTLTTSRTLSRSSEK